MIHAQHPQCTELVHMQLRNMAGNTSSLLKLTTFIIAVIALTVSNSLSLSTLQDTADRQNLSSIGNTSLIHPYTGRWDAQCYYNPSSRHPDFSPNMCEIIIGALCAHFQILDSEDIERSQWVWVELEGCAGAYYVAADAYLPGSSGCTLIMEEIYEKCVISSRLVYRAGSNNVKRMPKHWDDGEAEDPEQAMFILSSERLTLWPRGISLTVRREIWNSTTNRHTPWSSHVYVSLDI